MKNDPRVPRDEKREIRQEHHLTRPPRLEGKVKNAMMNSEKKPKEAASEVHPVSKKRQWYTEEEMTTYQLPNKKR